MSSIPFDPYGSWFVVFRRPGRPSKAFRPNTTDLATVGEVQGPWRVAFDQKWIEPFSVVFDRLTDWTVSEDSRVRYFSGTAVYRTAFDAPDASGPVYLDLGMVRELAEVSLNGHSLGIVWCPPFRVNVTPYLRPKANRLEIRVTNFWPNRIIGDAIEGTGHTQTNVRQLTAASPLMPSGLLGPVRLMVPAAIPGNAKR